MGNHDRGALLFEQGRYDEAIKEFKDILAQNPEDEFALMYIGWSLLIQEKYTDALEYCEMAYKIQPEDEFIAGNYAQALFRKNERNKSLDVLNHAISQFPYSHFLYYLKAQVHFFKEEFKLAEEAIKIALEIEPESTDLLNLYHQILIKLKKQDKAAKVMDYVLKEAPDNAFSHANLGWNYIQKQNSAKAKESFLEALRLSPNNEYAKEGLKEAIRIENPFYRTMHKFFLWMDKMSAGRQFSIIIALYILFRFIARISATYPKFAIFFQPLILLYIIFALSSWVARPFSNFFLQFHAIGRHILSKDERIGANLIGGSFMVAIIFLILSFFKETNLILLFYWMGLIGSVTFSGAYLFHAKSNYRKLFMVFSIALLATAFFGTLTSNKEISSTVYFYPISICILIYSFMVPILARKEIGRFYEK